MLRLEHREESRQFEEVGDSEQPLALREMDIGVFLCQRGTTNRKGYLLAAGVEKLNPQGPQRIEQSDRFKCIPVSLNF
jgi:hypothetical protein